MFVKVNKQKKRQKTQTLKYRKQAGDCQRRNGLEDG